MRNVIVFLFFLLFVTKGLANYFSNEVLETELHDFFSEQKLELLRLFLIENEPNIKGTPSKIKRDIRNSTRFDIVPREDGVKEGEIILSTNRYETKNVNRGKLCSKFEEEFEILNNLSINKLLEANSFSLFLVDNDIEILDVDKLDDELFNKYKEISYKIKTENCKEAKELLERARTIKPNEIENEEINNLCDSDKKVEKKQDSEKLRDTTPKGGETDYPEIEDPLDEFLNWIKKNTYKILSFLFAILSIIFFALFRKARNKTAQIDFKRTYEDFERQLNSSKKELERLRKENLSYAEQIRKKDDDLAKANSRINDLILGQKEVFKIENKNLKQSGEKNNPRPVYNPITYYTAGTDSNSDFVIANLSKDKGDGNPYYFEIFNIHGDFAEYKVINDGNQQQRAAHSASVILKGVCDYINLPADFSFRIETRENGRLEKKGNVYKINKNAKIFFQ